MLSVEIVFQEFIEQQITIRDAHKAESLRPTDRPSTALAKQLLE